MKIKSISFEALGTIWWIEIFDEIDETKSGAVEDRAASLLQEFEAKYSRFKPDSLITKLNTERALVTADAETRALLTYGQDLYQRTDGYFNLLVGHIMEARGYDANYTFDAIPTPNEPWFDPTEDLIINGDKIELKFGSIDIGGYGKGYVIDLLAENFKEIFGLKYFLINGGGDIYATSDHGEPITIHLDHPTKANTSNGQISLKDQAFASSSPFKRAWKDTNHIVKKIENEDVASYVIAESARDADAFATSALLMNEQELLTLATREHIGVARCSPTSNKLWHTKNFV